MLLRLLFCLFFYAVSFPVFADEKLLPEAEIWLSGTSKIAPETNGFYYLLGMAAAEKEDPWQVGYNYAQALEKVYEGNLGNQHKKPYPVLEKVALSRHPWLCEQLVTAEISQNCCQRQYCYQHYLKHSELLDDFIQSHTDLLAQYRQFTTYQNYQAILPPTIDTPYPEYRYLILAHHIFLSDVLNKYLHHQAEEALFLLADDLKFHRQQLSQQDILLGKLIRARLILHNLALLSVLIEQNPHLDLTSEPWLSVLSPLTALETDITHSLYYEFQTFANVFENIGNEIISTETAPAAFLSQFLKQFLPWQKNKTLNRIFQVNKLLAELSKLPTDQLYQQLPSSEEIEKIFEPKGFFDKASNYVGYTLLAIAMPNLNAYIGEIHNLNGHFVLLQAYAKIKALALDKTAVKDFLEKSNFRSPFTNAPLHWDAQKNQLLFENLNAERNSLIVDF